MSEPLERQQVIELLEKLGNEADDEVLQAARTLHNQITESGMGWEDLLVEDDSESGEEPHTNPLNEEDFYDDSEDEQFELDTPTPIDETQTLSLLEKLLARDDISSDLRAELEDEKLDFIGGNFESGDHRYIHSLFERLTKR